MKKQPEITEKTRQAFVDVFCELYSQKPIEKISVQEITNRSGYNRSTFYQYFCDIYELLAYIENDVLDYIREKLKNKKHSVMGHQDFVQLYSEKGIYLSTLLGDYGRISFLEKIKTEIALDENDLNLPEDNSLTPYLVEFHISTSLSLFRHWLRREKDLPPKELFDLIDRLLMAGLGSVFKDV